MPSQCERIKQYIDDFVSITPIEALRDLGCQRLAARISDLRKKGFAITSERVAGTNRYGEKTVYARYKWGE